MKKTKIIIAGAGISGASLARVLAEQNFKVEVYEKKAYVAGHIYDFEKEKIIIQKYGPHIFHSSKQNVINFVQRFWKLNNFKNCVKGYVDNKLVPIPFNFESIDICFPKNAEQIKKLLIANYPERDSVPILELEQNNNPLIKKLSSFIYKNVFANYTSKMWGLDPLQIDKSVTARIPVILSYYNRYFKDNYEGIPLGGYTKAIAKILDHKNIIVHLNSDIKKIINFGKDKIIIKNQSQKHILVYSGPIDSLFDNQFGILDYRSLNIVFEKINQARYQECAVINYPAHPIMTRITEFKHFYPDHYDLKYSYISKEYPGKYNPNSKLFSEPYYPLANESARQKYLQYFKISQRYKNLYMLGRLAKFKYINMDQAIDEALILANQIIKEYQ